MVEEGGFNGFFSGFSSYTLIVAPCCYSHFLCFPALILDLYRPDVFNDHNVVSLVVDNLRQSIGFGHIHQRHLPVYVRYADISKPAFTFSYGACCCVSIARVSTLIIFCPSAFILFRLPHPAPPGPSSTLLFPSIPFCNIC